MMNSEQGTADVGGQYTIRVALSTLLSADQVQDLRAALQVSYDDGTAGQFNIESSGETSVVTFYREISDDWEVIQTNLATGRLSWSDAETMVVAQLADELSEHDDESSLVRDIVATLRVPGAAKSMVAGVDMFRDMLAAIKVADDKALQDLQKSRHWIAKIVDERAEGGAIFANLMDGFAFADDPTFSVKGFDTVAALEGGTRRSDVAWQKATPYQSQDEAFEARVEALSRLQQSAGAPYTLYLMATKALQGAFGLAKGTKGVDWATVHQEVYDKAVVQDQQPVAQVLAAIKQHSPGAVTPEQIAAVDAMGGPKKLTMQMHTLAAILAFIDEHDEWWVEEVDGAEGIAGNPLKFWMASARAAVDDMAVIKSLGELVALVDAGVLHWDWEYEVLDEARTHVLAPALHLPQGSGAAVPQQGSTPQAAQGGIKTAIKALKLAAECGGDLDKPFYQEALAGLLRVNSQVLAYDASLNARAVAPDGSDFNEVFEMLGLDPASVANPTEAMRVNMRQSLREDQPPAAKALGSVQAQASDAGLTRQEAMEQFKRLTARYGVQWTASVPREAFEQLAACNRVLTENDRREAFGLSNRRDDGPSP